MIPWSASLRSVPLTTARNSPFCSGFASFAITLKNGCKIPLSYPPITSLPMPASISACFNGAPGASSKVYSRIWNATYSFGSKSVPTTVFTDR